MSHNYVSIPRSLEYLNKRRIVYRRNPITDKPSYVFDGGMFFEDGTYQCYDLFRSKAKITTYRSLKWHLYVLWYLNPQLDQESFNSIAEHVCNKRSGFVTFKVSEQLLQSMIYDVSLMDLERPPPNRLRKVIFKDFTGLTMYQKLSIVGKLVGKHRLSENEIYEAMLLINDDKSKITVDKLAIILNCSTRTIYRNMSMELKKEKELLNQQRQD